MDFDTKVKLSVYNGIAESGIVPDAPQVAASMAVSVDEVLAAFQRLFKSRLLVLEPNDPARIRMAPPFSGVPTQHRVRVDGVDYLANCAWDALGIPAALHRPGQVVSRCEQSREVLHLDVGKDGPAPSPWLFHCLVPAARWWADIVFT